MHKITIKLKQHTPLIHFQHDQDGATLRASEVKPRLDKFIINNLKETGQYDKGVQEGWIKKKNDKEWLDYKMMIDTANTQVMKMELDTGKVNERTGNPIISKMPLFFGNMSNDEVNNTKEMSFTTLPVYVVIRAKSESLIKIIDSFKYEFFLHNNFGTRQSKGFGSFFPIEQITSKMKPTFYFFCVPSYNVGNRDDFINLFQYIDLFYKTIRSGINQSGYYFKSMMYHYAKYKSEYWDKRAIRTHFELFAEYNKERRKSFELFGNKLAKKEQLDRGEERDNAYDGNKGRKIDDDSHVKLYRDVLGLSSIQEWGFYGATISKNNPEIERHKSPILLKPIYDEGTRQYYVYVIPQIVPSGFLNRQMEVSVEYKSKNNSNPEKHEKRQWRNSSNMSITTPLDFNVAKYLYYIFDGPGHIILEEQINKMPDAFDKNGKKRNGIKEKLKRIYKIK